MEEKKKSKAGLIFAIIGIVVVVAAAAYGLYRFFAPDYLEDFEDDFDDDFEDDFFEEDDGDAEKKPAKQVSENHYHLHNLTGEDVKGCVISCSPFTECAGNAADDMCFWKRIVRVR